MTMTSLVTSGGTNPLYGAGYFAVSSFAGPRVSSFDPGAPIIATIGSTRSTGSFLVWSLPWFTSHVGTFMDFMRLPSLSTSEDRVASSVTTT